MYSTQLWLHKGKQSTVMKYDLADRPDAGNLAQNNTFHGQFGLADGK